MDLPELSFLERIVMAESNRLHFPKMNKYSRHAQYYKMHLLLRSLNERALGIRIKERQLFCFQMPTRKCARWAEVFHRNLERGVCLKAEKICQNIPVKMDQEKFCVVEDRA